MHKTCSWYNCLFTIWPRGTNSWWTVPFQSENTTSITLIFDWLICALFGWGDPFPILPVCLVKQSKCLCKFFIKLAAKFHTHTHTHTRSSSSFIVTLSLIWRTTCALAQFSGCSFTTNAHSETGQMAVCCHNLMLGVLSSRNMLPVLVGAI
jgi:hypothetical protein